MSTDFTVEISQNEYLAEGAEDVNAIVTVTSPDTGLAAPVDDLGSAEIIIIDCSGSMRSPRTKIEQARAATAAPVDVIRDGVAFAVIAGTNKAQPIFPLDYGLTIADDQTRFLDTRSTKTVRTKK
jgi:Mg-chelatase subunit ChlD